MSLVLEQKYSYILFDPLDSVRSQLKAVLSTPWYDIAVSLSGKLFDDNSFKVYPKLSMGVEVFNVVQHVALIEGRLDAEGKETRIFLKIRPTYAVSLSFYLILLIFLFKVATVFISATGRDWIFAGSLFIVVVIFRSVIHFSIERLKNRFERTMSLHL